MSTVLPSVVLPTQKKPIPKRRSTDRLLLDLSNSTYSSNDKRQCLTNAMKLISKQTKREAPRGQPQKGAEIRELNRTSTDANKHVESITLQSKLKILTEGGTRLDKYITENTTVAVQKAYALSIFQKAVTKSSQKILEAAETASLYSGFSAQVIRRWAMTDFVQIFASTSCLEDTSDEEISDALSSQRGSHSKLTSLINDEVFSLEAAKYIREHGYQKGAPNLTIDTFVKWVEDVHDKRICVGTASAWMHKLGFDYRQFSKGVYFDGHDRADVVEDRIKYCTLLKELEPRILTSDTNTSEIRSTERPIIRLFHDESTFYSNADQTFHWTDNKVQALKQKSLGQAIMVSDFISEVDGYLRHGDQEAREYLEHQTQGYWTNDLVIKQALKAIDIFEAKYPNAVALFIYDNAPSHTKKPDDALNADRMNVNPGGKQPKMRSTMFNGEVQQMTLADGRPKGMRLVLEERGVNLDGKKAKNMVEILKTYDDFKTSKAILTEVIECRGHMCIFLPKFHCELNPIERCWCQAKKHTRAYANGSIVRLRKIVREGLETVTMDMIKKFFLTCKDYETAYREGYTTHNVDNIVSIYRSHRRVSINT